MSKDNSGPAFPSQIRNDGEDPINGFIHEEIPAGTTSNYAGMSLRDYFAAKAMQAYVTRGGYPDDGFDELISKWAFEIADVMLAERAK